MGMFPGMDVSAGALSVERLRLNVIADNIANAESTRGANGGPYRRKQVIVAEKAAAGFPAPGADDIGSGVQAAGIIEDPEPPRMMYDPSHPDANAQGYVRMPNVDVPTEIVDMMAATRAYEANATAFQAQRRSQERSLELLA
jgi:flagellar basal-body rod protein FlgC